MIFLILIAFMYETRPTKEIALEEENLDKNE